MFSHFSEIASARKQPTDSLLCHLESGNCLLDPSQRINRAKRGDRKGFDDLYDWLVTPVYRYAWTHVRDVSAAEEISSEAFLALVSNLPEMPEMDSAVLAWMRRVVRNKSVDWIRRNQNQRKAWESIAALGDGPTQRQNESPATTLESREDHDRVHQVLACLPDEYRDALELRYLDDLSLQQIASTLGISASATNSLLYRSREAFRKRCGPRPDSADDACLFSFPDRGATS